MASKLKYSTGHIIVSEVHEQVSGIGRNPTLATLITMRHDAEEVMDEVDEFYEEQMKARVASTVPDAGIRGGT